MSINRDDLRKLFDYHSDGYLIWKSGTHKNQRAGSPNKLQSGLKRSRIRIGLKSYGASRLIFLWHYGFLPPIIDHADRNQLNDRIDNLRAATSSQNALNRKPSCHAASGFKGVHKQRNKWRVRVTVDNKKESFGVYETKEEAAYAYNLIASHYYGQFTCLNEVSLP